jgi:hypothetical protein
VIRLVEKLVEGVFFHLKSEDYELLAKVLDDISENLVQPMAAAIADAETGLANEENASNSAIKRWPLTDDPPSHLSPGDTEFLVEPVDDYPRFFISLVSDTANAGVPAGGSRVLDDVALSVAERQVASVGTPRRPMENLPPRWVETLNSPPEHPQALIEFSAPWEPRALGIGRRAAVGARCKAQDITERAEAWLFERQFPFDRFLREDLQHYVQSEDLSDPVRSEREAAFIDAFTKAAQAARPLIGINPGSLERVHKLKSPEVDYRFSRIPFGPSTPIGAFVSDYLVSNRMTREDELKSMLSPDGPPLHRVDIFTILARPLQPMVFESITAPILSEWNVCKSDPRPAEARRAFWQWRRTRSLPDCIPATGEAAALMTRGWLTAALLGQTQVENFDDPDAIVVRVWDANAETFVAFPTPLLEYDPSDRRSLLPGLLLNLGIGIVSYSEAPDVFVPYQRIYDLGQSEGSSRLNAEFLRVIKNGLPASAPDVALGQTADERSQTLLTKLRSSRANYAKLDDQSPRADEDVTPQWEYFRQVLAAHDFLTDRIEGLSQQDEVL